jgi:hypothetical protein
LYLDVPLEFGTALPIATAIAGFGEHGEDVVGSTDVSIRHPSSSPSDVGEFTRTAVVIVAADGSDGDNLSSHSALQADSEDNAWSSSGTCGAELCLVKAAVNNPTAVPIAVEIALEAAQGCGIASVVEKCGLQVSKSTPTSLSPAGGKACIGNVSHGFTQPSMPTLTPLS